MEVKRAVVNSALLVMLFVHPLVTLAAVAGNAVLSVLWIAGNLFASILPRYSPRRLDSVDGKSRITVIIPTYNEPPEMVISTLKSLLTQTYRNYRAVVVDSNTPDPAVWKPVEKFCSRQDRMDFHHIEGITGFKSGALNWVLPRIDPKTDYVLILDADYELETNAIETALSYAIDEKVGLVQFPQAYKNVSGANRGLMLDFSSFFLTYMNMANWLDCVPSTGTISFLKYRALRKAGEFSRDCITEDAEIGFRLNFLGYKGIYVNTVIGKGLMPYDITALKKQRYRWGFGNLQIIKNNFAKLMTDGSLSFKQKIGFLIQLTAWFNLNLASVVVILVLGAADALWGISGYYRLALDIAAVNLTVHLVFRLMSFIIGLSKYGYGIIPAVEAYVSHLGLSTVHLSSWFNCIVDGKYHFERTNKFISEGITGPVRSIIPEIILSVAGIVVAAFELSRGNVIAGTGAVALTFMFASVLYLAWQMVRTRELSFRIVKTMAA